MTCIGSLIRQPTILLAAALLCFVLTSADQTQQLPIPYANSYDTSDSDLQTAETAPGSYVQHYDQGADGYKVQSGFEGYIIPAKHHKLEHIKEVKKGIIHHILSTLEPILHIAHAVLPKVGLLLISVVALVAIGTVVSTCVCAYTSICHMTFMGFDLTKEQMRGFMNQQSLTEATRFVRAAIKKYQEYNAEHKESQRISKNLVK